jgi:ribosomal protein S18 acetylase RimI-like enzyme
MDSPIDIREAVPGDERALALVAGATFLESYAGVLPGDDIVDHCAAHHSPEAYARWLADPRATIWLAEWRGRGSPVGYLLLTPADVPVADPDPSDLEIRRIYLLESLRGQGAGRRLVEQAVAAARERGARRLLLGVYQQNERAIGFYGRMGFEVVGTRRFRVGAHEYDDYVLGLRLS